MRKNLKWTKEKVLAEIRAFHKSGRPLNPTTVTKEHRLHRKLLLAAERYFGNWREAIKAAGFDYREVAKIVREWSKEKIIAEIKAVYKAKGTLRYAEFYRSGKGLYFASLKHFGSWRKAVEAAGFDYDKFRAGRKWTKEKVISEIQAFYKAKGTLRNREISQHNANLREIARRHFGSWRKAVEAAGFDYDQFLTGHQWTKRKIISEIKALYRAKGTLQHREVYKSNQPLVSAAIYYFGSWRNAVEATGFDYDQFRVRRQWAKEEIIAEIRSYYKNKKTLQYKEVHRDNEKLRSAACKLFGSWRKAVEAAGFDYDQFRYGRKR